MIHQTKLSKHFSSINYLSLSYVHPFPSHGERGYLSQIWYFVCNLRVDYSRNDKIWTTPKGLNNAISRYFIIPNASKEDDGALQQQWISFLTPYHPLSHADTVPQIWYFAFNLRVNLDRNDMVWTIRGMVMLPAEALSALFIVHLRKVMKNFASNECTSA